MDISMYDVVIKRHAFIRAMERGIDPDMIEQVLHTGKVVPIGKSHLKFINRGSKRTIICVGEIRGNRIKIITIEEGN